MQLPIIFIKFAISHQSDKSMYLLGYDIGSSSVKASIIDSQSGRCMACDFFPKQEAAIISEKAGWAEQEPESWWKNLKLATASVLAKSGVDKRGELVSWNQFAIIFGQLVVYFVNLVILGDHIAPDMEELAEGLIAIVNGEALEADGNWSVTTGWRLMFGSECIPAALFSILILLVSETKGKTLEEMTMLWKSKNNK